MSHPDFRNSVTAKILFIGFLTLLMLIPTGMIQGTINERTNRQREAEDEIGSKWGRPQELSGPIVNLPYLYRWEETINKIKIPHTETRYLHLFPETLAYKTEITPEVRKRGIFEVTVYQGKVNIQGTFQRPDLSSFEINDQDVLWDKASLSLGIGDTRGITENTSITWNGESKALQPTLGKLSLGINPITNNYGQFMGGSVLGGMNTSVSLNQEGSIPFALELNIKGSQEIRFWPLGKSTSAEIKSSWQAPSFVGNFLPEQNDDNQTFADGFNARWNISYFGRSYPQIMTGEDFSTRQGEIQNSAFGVRLIKEVDFYQKNERSIKYAVLFIGLTFLSFFCFEVLGEKRRVHPFQYLLVGMAMSLFYLLLLSFSEYLGFGGAYLIASVATTGLVGMYSFSVLKNKKSALSIGGVLICIYLYLYTLLQLEDFALLLGSVVTFLILGAIMFITRKVDWYGMELGKE